MCGRYTLRRIERIGERFHVVEQPTLIPRYNIAPTQPVAAVRVDPELGRRELTMLYWGLIPPWAKDPSIGARMINVRSETAPEKPAFRKAFLRRRCLLPADGFYEWRQEGKQKQPHLIQMRDEDLFALGGLWEHWQDAPGNEIESCTILTTPANELLRPIHDRMPVIIPSYAYHEWLDPATPPQRVGELVGPYPAEQLQVWAVSRHVNSARNDDPACVQPL